MVDVHNLADVQERLYTLRDELARVKPAARPGVNADLEPRERQQRRQLAEQRLEQIEAGLYPICADCGQRIEIERLRVNAMEARCAHCAARAEGKVRGHA